MALATKSGVLRFHTSGTPVFTDPLTVSTLLFTNRSDAAEWEASVLDGDGSTVLFTVAVPPDSSLAIPFGSRGKTFDSGLGILVGADIEMAAFLGP